MYNPKLTKYQLQYQSEIDRIATSSQKERIDKAKSIIKNALQEVGVLGIHLLHADWRSDDADHDYYDDRSYLEIKTIDSEYQISFAPDEMVD